MCPPSPLLRSVQQQPSDCDCGGRRGKKHGCHCGHTSSLVVAAFSHPPSLPTPSLLPFQSTKDGSVVRCAVAGQSPPLSVPCRLFAIVSPTTSFLSRSWHDDLPSGYDDAQPQVRCIACFKLCATYDICTGVGPYYKLHAIRTGFVPCELGNKICGMPYFIAQLTWALILAGNMRSAQGLHALTDIVLRIVGAPQFD